jgi:hypothetical protein
VRQGASWTAAYHRQLTVAAVPDPSVAACVSSASLLLSGPGGCSPRRRLPAAASSQYRELGRRRRGRHGQQPRHGIGRRCPACGVHPSGFGVRDPAVRPSGVRSAGVVVQRVRRSAVCCPPIQRPTVQRPTVQRPTVQRLPPSVRTRPSLPLRRWRLGPGRTGRATVTTGTGGGPWGYRGVDGSTDGRGGRDSGDAADVALVRGGGWRTRAAGLGAGRGGRACLLSDQAGQAGLRSARRGRLRCGHGAGGSARWRHRTRGWRPRLGATTVGGRRRA